MVHLLSCLIILYPFLMNYVFVLRVWGVGKLKPVMSLAHLVFYGFVIFFLTNSNSIDGTYLIYDFSIQEIGNKEKGCSYYD